MRPDPLDFPALSLHFSAFASAFVDNHALEDDLLATHRQHHDRRAAL